MRLLPTKLPQNIKLPSIAETILNANLLGLENVTGTKTELLLFLGSNTDKSTLRKELKSLEIDITGQTNHYILPICFSKGTDWSSVEALTGVQKTKHIEQILKSRLSLSMYGFLPGFMYLDGLIETLQIPRKPKPTKKISPGSFAIGGPYAGVYNIESPGGWHVIGNCPVQLFNASSILSPFVNIGDTFALKKISLAEWKSLNADKVNIKDYN